MRGMLLLTGEPPVNAAEGWFNLDAVAPSGPFQSITYVGVL